MSNKKRIAVLFGGQSSEHEVSRVSAQSVISNLNRDKYEVVMIGITKGGRWLCYDGPVEKIGSGEWQTIAEQAAEHRSILANTAPIIEMDTGNTKKGFAETTVQTDMVHLPDANSARNIFNASGAGAIDVVFPVLHGINGEDGTIQGLFDLAGIPYVGCGVLGSAMGMDKGYSKIIFEKEGIPQGKYLVFNRKQIEQDPEALSKEVEAVLEYPCFVKPSNAGSSVGVSKAHDRGELIKALEFAAKYDRRVLVEEFINGREIECAVLGNDEPAASTVGEVIPCKEFYDYEAKYQSGDGSRVEIPANIPRETAEEIRGYAVRAFKSLDCAGLSRVDFFVHKKTGKVYINEINTLPGFTSISMYPKMWEASGITYPKLLEKLIDLAVERFRDTRREF